MKNDNVALYITPMLEVIKVECNDIVTTSSVILPGDAPGNTPSTPPNNASGGFIADDNFLGIW